MIFEKFEILFIIFILLLLFYAAISLGARKKKQSLGYNEVKRYLFGVNILIIIIGVVSFILWLVAFLLN